MSLLFRSYLAGILDLPPERFTAPRSSATSGSSTGSPTKPAWGIDTALSPAVIPGRKSTCPSSGCRARRQPVPVGRHLLPPARTPSAARLQPATQGSAYLDDTHRAVARNLHRPQRLHARLRPHVGDGFIDHSAPHVSGWRQFRTGTDWEKRRYFEII
jgi:hypothetical protein